MHFRIRGNNVQVVKTETNAAGKKKSVPVGSFRKNDLEIPDSLKEKLSAAEIKEVKAWVTHSSGVEDMKAKMAAFTLAEQIDLAVTWLNKADKAEATFVVDSVLESMRKLRKALTEKV